METELQLAHDLLGEANHLIAERDKLIHRKNCYAHMLKHFPEQKGVPSWKRHVNYCNRQISLCQEEIDYRIAMAENISERL